MCQGNADKTALRFLLIPVRKAIMNNKNDSDCSLGYGEERMPLYCWLK